MSALRTQADKDVFVVTDGPAGHIYEIVQSKEDAETIAGWHNSRDSNRVAIFPVTLVTDASVK
jgi:hypothetical protein